LIQAISLVITTGLSIHAIVESDSAECMAWILLSLDTFRHMRDD